MLGKLASAYFAWFNADGERSAWKVKYCLADAADSLAGILNASQQAEQSPNIFACILCGANCETDSDPIYCTLFLPGMERRDFDLQLDAACAARFRIPIVQTGQKQANRELQPARDRAVEAWAALGILPVQTPEAA